MEDELAHQCSHLKISTVEEEDVVELGDNTDDNINTKIALSLVGRVLTLRSYNFVAMKNTMNQVWSLSQKAIFRAVDSNLFDREKVLNGRPWCFDQNLIIIQEMDGSMQPSEVDLDASPSWIRLYNMPFKRRNKEDIHTVASRISEVLEIKEDEIGWDKFCRASPRKGRTAMREEVQEQWKGRRMLTFHGKPKEECSKKGRTNSGESGRECNSIGDRSNWDQDVNSSSAQQMGVSGGKGGLVMGEPIVLNVGSMRVKRSVNLSAPKGAWGMIIVWFVENERRGC
ncbi:Lysine--tRNA ligase [Bienertia sinuspersici]